MSGGRIAIAGFDYQGIVILDHLFDHFDQHGATARARPEGQDDLDLIWSEAGRDRRHHVQVKKPRETDAGVPTRKPWRLSEVADELLPNTLDQLTQSDSLQTWVLGDPVQPQVHKLLAAGLAAPVQEPRSYWTLVQRMARSQIADHLDGKSRKVLLEWKLKDPSDVAEQARDNLIGGFDQLAQSRGAGSEHRRAYRDRVLWLALSAQIVPAGNWRVRPPPLHRCHGPITQAEAPAQPLSLVRQLAGSYPPGRDDVRQIPAIPAQRRGPSP